MIIDSAATTTATATGKAGADQQRLEEDLFNFLNLLVTQLQAQDPLDPMDANEFTSQLVQFANVEQQIYQNSHLETLVGLQESNQAAAMVNYLGTMVEAEGKSFTLADGGAQASYTLPETALETTLVVKNDRGQPVYTIGGETGAGRHSFEWDGHDADGRPLPDGVYTLDVSAKHGDQSPMPVSQTVYGRITGAAADGGRAVLFMGDVQIPMEDVLSVREPERQVTDRGEPASDSEA
ncbi:MAG: flagellar hook assembly protein FlgD [Rhodospirillales bacterium]|nr:flagellar hook assembly protein FlgD [Rhodospirillales bacterium]